MSFVSFFFIRYLIPSSVFQTTRLQSQDEFCHNQMSPIPIKTIGKPSKSVFESDSFWEIQSDVDSKFQIWRWPLWQFRCMEVPLQVDPNRSTERAEHSICPGIFDKANTVEWNFSSGKYQKQLGYSIWNCRLSFVFIFYVVLTALKSPFENCNCSLNARANTLEWVKYRLVRIRRWVSRLRMLCIQQTDVDGASVSPLFVQFDVHRTWECQQTPSTPDRDKRISFRAFDETPKSFKLLICGICFRIAWSNCFSWKTIQLTIWR